MLFTFFYSIGRNAKISLFLSFFLLAFLIGIRAETLKLHYNLASDVAGSTSVLDQSGNGLNGTLVNGAKINTYDGVNVIDLGTSKGYVDMGTQLGSVVATLTNYSVVTKIFIPTTSDDSGAGNFIWTFSNSSDNGATNSGCVFLSARNTRCAITKTGWRNESGMEAGTDLAKGAWKTVIYVQGNGVGRIFVDGVLVKSSAIAITPSELGATAFNYIGRSAYSTDAYLSDAKIADFRVYDGALTVNQIYELSGITPVPNAELLAEFNFDNTSDKSGKYVGSLKNGATLKTVAGKGVLDLGGNNGYFDFGSAIGSVVSTLDHFAISANMYIPNAENITAAGNFVWTFANSDNMGSAANGNMFFSAGTSRYSISKTDYRAESAMGLSKPLDKGRWINVTYTQVNGAGGVYINGVKLSTDATVSINPSALGATAYNYLGRSCYSADAYLKNAQFSKFCLYKGALSETDIMALNEELAPLRHYSDSVTLKQAYDQISIANADSITRNLSLTVKTAEGVVIAWTSSTPAVISNDGVVTRPAFGQPSVGVMLTATLSFGGMTLAKAIPVTVISQCTDQQSVELDLGNLKLPGNIHNVYTSVKLPVETLEGSHITWKSGDLAYMNDMGKVLKLSPAGAGKKTVVLTATATKGESSATKNFEVSVAEDDAKSAYLFVYFTGNSQDQEQVRYGLSNDGINYTPLNNGNRVIYSDSISIKKAVRDPHVLRGIDGKTFYMVVTDMRSAEGWESNRGIVLLKSTDLINWKHATVNFPTRWPAQWAGVTRVWAPQTIYDPEAKKYMVYFSVLTNDGKCTYDKVYYCYANQDFTDLEGEPQLLFDRGASTIDSDINFNEGDGLYHLFYKNENDGGISKVTSSRLTQLPGQAPSSQWSTPSGKLQQTTQGVEGVGIFKKINSDQWFMMYDCYMNGHYQFCTSPDLTHFSFAQDNYNISARHGTSMTITAEEATRLLNAFPTTGLSNTPQGARNVGIRKNYLTIDQAAKKIHLPVASGTDITAFDPELYASPGTQISPAGEQDFSKGALNYNFTLNAETVSYQVDVTVEVNPIIPDLHADPEVLYSEKTGLFYIYPTTDGYANWGGYTFDVFSSPNLVDWTNEGTMLDVKSSQVSWASGNAWAPAIIEKKAGGDYKYYFYFSAESSGKKIGVAVANNPVGPFTDSGSPIVSDRPAGVSGGQQIDVDVFNDPQSGKNYIYWGNGYMAVAELNDDMVSLKSGTTKVITPSGGTVSDYQYREGSYVFYRNGLYYFLWSVDDTGSSNYHVAYGTSTSPTGPINVAASPIVIAQDAANEIYGPAHNSILQIPGRDEWYIVYHRINKNYLSNSPGTHREVCIDSLKFNADGTIRRVTPTKRGISPVSLAKGDGTALNPVADNQPKGNVISVELYSINGMQLSYKNRTLEKGVYILKKKYDSGTVTTTKIIVCNPGMRNNFY
ncbi:MAG TPA: family 43 glycosylhydrolase [Paludibacter sp.]|nr:family 43 glycosylhydrolase [Paludibacter sp.]